MSVPTMNDIRLGYIEASIERGWRLLVLDMRGELVLENADGTITLTVKGVLVTPEFIRKLPEGGVPAAAA